jgi:hypothetical protein
MKPNMNNICDSNTGSLVVFTYCSKTSLNMKVPY